MKQRPTSQQGFAAVAAIFLVVVLAALGSYMVSFSNTQQLTSAQDVQGSRAYWAARAGLEWGLASVVASACPVSPTGLTVQDFSVSVTCVPRAYSEGGGTVTILQFVSTATGGAGSGTVERSVSAAMEN
jgi:MSHA biogenesis protein MshP